MNKDTSSTTYVRPAARRDRLADRGAAAPRRGRDEQVRSPDGRVRPRRRRRALAAVVSGLLVLGIGLLVIELLPTRYVATCTVSFSPRTQLNVDAAAVRLVAQKYAVVAGSTTTVASAARATSISSNELHDALSVSQPSDTSNLNIKVSLPERIDAARAANAIGAIVTRSAADDRFVSSSVTGPAAAGAAEVQPSRPLLRTLAVAAALLVAGWVAYAAGYVDRRTRERS
ncbi:hypothetical protein [Streptomyces griseosporeus]